MSNLALQNDIGAFLVGKNAIDPQTVTAGSTNDNAELTGYAVDRNVGDTSTGVTGEYMGSGQVVIPVTYSLSAAETVTVTSNVEHASATGSTWVDITDKDGSSNASEVFGSTGSTAAQTGHDELRYNLDLKKAKRYVRVMVTTNLSATATDTADVAAVLVMGGYGVVPASS